MPRVFVSSSAFTAAGLTVTGPHARHLAVVLRLQPGDTFGAIDEDGREHTVRISYAGPDRVRGTVVATHELDTEPNLRLTLAQAIAKSRKMDLVIQKATELGAFDIRPMVTQRVVVRRDAERVEDRRDRWQRIAHEAARQCGRTIVPQVHATVPFDEALQRLAKCDLALLLTEQGASRPISKVFAKRLRADTIGLAVGPEGGFARSEVEQALQVGVVPVTMGPRILRTETAALAAVSIVLYAMGEMDDEH
jgi:16S rRNA (uracil1498-N3)-methyltransferase